MEYSEPLQLVRYDPYVQTAEQFNEYMGPLFDAPGFQEFFLNHSEAEILNIIEAHVSYAPAPISSQQQCRECKRGHRHLQWPTRGTIIIQKCETFCWFCELIFSSAANLRKHVRYRHISKDRMQIQVLESTSGRQQIQDAISKDKCRGSRGRRMKKRSLIAGEPRVLDRSDSEASPADQWPDFPDSTPASIASSYTEDLQQLGSPEPEATWFSPGDLMGYHEPKRNPPPIISDLVANLDLLQNFTSGNIQQDHQMLSNALRAIRAHNDELIQQAARFRSMHQQLGDTHDLQTFLARFQETHRKHHQAIDIISGRLAPASKRVP